MVSFAHSVMGLKLDPSELNFDLQSRGERERIGDSRMGTAQEGLPFGSLKGDLHRALLRGYRYIDIDIAVDSYLSCLKGVSKSVQVLFNGIDAPAPPNCPLSNPQYPPIETIRPLIQVHWRVKAVAELALMILK